MRVRIGDHAYLRGKRLESLFLQRFEHAVESGRIGRYGDDAAVVYDVVGACFETDFHNRIFRYFFGVVFDRAFARKHAGNRTGYAELSAVFVEDVAHVGCRAIFIVGKRFDEDGNSARSVSFVDELFVGFSVRFAGAFFDRAFDIVFRHTRRPRF